MTSVTPGPAAEEEGEREEEEEEEERRMTEQNRCRAIFPKTTSVID